MRLDPFSSDCFIDENIIPVENRKAIPIKLSLTTMKENKKKLTCHRIEHIHIQCIDGKTKAILDRAILKSNWPLL